MKLDKIGFLKLGGICFCKTKFVVNSILDSFYLNLRFKMGSLCNTVMGPHAWMCQRSRPCVNMRQKCVAASPPYDLAPCFAVWWDACDL